MICAAAWMRLGADREDAADGLARRSFFDAQRKQPLDQAGDEVGVVRLIRDLPKHHVAANDAVIGDRRRRLQQAGVAAIDRQLPRLPAAAERLDVARVAQRPRRGKRPEQSAKRSLRLGTRQHLAILGVEQNDLEPGQGVEALHQFAQFRQLEGQRHREENPRERMGRFRRIWHGFGSSEPLQPVS